MLCLREEELFSCALVRDENVFGDVGRVRCSDHSHEALQFSGDAQNQRPMDLLPDFGQFLEGEGSTVRGDQTVSNLRKFRLDIGHPVNG